MKEGCNAKVTATNNEELTAELKGQTSVWVSVKGNKEEIKINDVLYVPNLIANLFSVNKIVQKGHKVTFNRRGCIIRDKNGNIMATATAKDGIYELDEQRSSTVQ